MSELNEIKNLLEAELLEVQKANRWTRNVSIVFVLIVGVYLGWANAQVNVLLDPEGLADAATGVAVDSIPEASATLKATLIDGAPLLAGQASEAVVSLIPMYREQLEMETKPIVNDVAAILADAAVRAILKSTKTGENARSEAINAGADAVIVQFDNILQEAMDQPDDEGRTPRQAIESSVSQLSRIDKELKKIANGTGDAKERELLITWMNILTQYQDEKMTAGEF